MKLIILNRDGVINQDSDELIKSPEEWIAIPGSLKAISRLNRAGYQLVVITNQSGLGRGLFNIKTLNAIHDKMHQQLSELSGHVESILFCPHRAEDNCDCRKPKPGLYIDLQKRLGISLTGVNVVGDSLQDCQAAQEVGASPVLVRTGKGEDTISSAIGLDNIPVFDDLATFTQHLLSTNPAE